MRKEELKIQAESKIQIQKRNNIKIVDEDEIQSQRGSDESEEDEM